MRYVKQFSEKFVWYAAVGYDMVPECVATNWKLLPEKIVPAVIQGWNIQVKDGNRLVLEPVEDETIISDGAAKPSQHFLTLLYWMPTSNIGTIFRNKYMHHHIGAQDPELLHISEYQGYPILGISHVKFNNKESYKIKESLQKYFQLRGLIQREQIERYFVSTYHPEQAVKLLPRGPLPRNPIVKFDNRHLFSIGLSDVKTPTDSYQTTQKQTPTSSFLVAHEQIDHRLIPDNVHFIQKQNR